MLNAFLITNAARIVDVPRKQHQCTPKNFRKNRARYKPCRSARVLPRGLRALISYSRFPEGHQIQRCRKRCLDTSMATLRGKRGKIATAAGGPTKKPPDQRPRRLKMIRQEPTTA